MIEVNDRVVLSEEAIAELTKSFWGETLEEWGVDLQAFGAGTVTDVVPISDGWNRDKLTAIVKWDKPQTLVFEDEDGSGAETRILDHIALCWLEKVESDA